MLYLVMGTCGWYEDRECWPVKPFKTREKAELYVKFLQQERAKFNSFKHYVNKENTYWPEGMKEVEAYMKMYDPNFNDDYTVGVSWYVENILDLTD